jgi:chorismate dehydratase
MRIGAVSYLNTKPLVYGLAELSPQHELVFDLPSRLADDLAAGRLDVALIPSIEFFRGSNYRIVSDACIGCRGPVRSVKLFSRVPLERIETLALDEGSRTSVALVRILLQERHGVVPELLPFPIAARPESIKADALLVIGDRAMRGQAGSLSYELDLGDAWCQWAELPFVFAMWVAGERMEVGGQRSEEELGELAAVLSRARDLGVANVEEIAEREHGAVGISYEECLVYLRDHLHFYLHEREMAGLRLFYERASGMGLAPKGVELELAGTKPGPGRLEKRAGLAGTGGRFAAG